MTPLELLNEGIAKNDMEIIKQAQTLISQQQTHIGVDLASGIDQTILSIIKPTKRQYSEKDKVVGKKLTPKTKTFKNDEEYFTYLYELEKQHNADIASGKAPPMVGDSPISVDYLGACVKELVFDKKTVKIKKKRTERRPPVKYRDVVCPRCGKGASIRQDEYNMYNWNMANVESTLPTYSCPNC